MLRIATIGTSMITDDFIQVVNANDQAVFVGTLSRDANRGAAFTAERDGERNFTSLDELAAAADVDAVYIGSPNALHYEQALACIAGGKHVIVEKPFCATEAQALEVFRAAEAAGVVALEAMRPLHDPAFHAIEDALGEIAPIRRASLRFGKYSSRYNEILAGRATNIFDCNMASGSLMDIGVYTVEPMVEIFGMPSGLTSMITLLDPTTRQLTHGPIDGCGSILASYGGGRISVELAHSKITNDLLPSQIEGERGTIQIDHLSTPRNVRIDYRGDVVRGSATEAPREQGDNGRVLDLPESSNTMEYELTDFISAIGGIDNVKEEIWETPAGRHELGHYRDVTLVSLRIMDAVRQQAGITFPADAGIAMGLFDTFFSSVTGGSREPQKPSNVELELRRRLTVLASDEATQDAPLRYFLRWEGQVQGVGFRFTNTNLAQARALTGWVRNMEDGSVEMEIQGAPANILSHLEALHASYERMGTRFRLVDAQTRAPLANEDGFIPRY